MAKRRQTTQENKLTKRKLNRATILLPGRLNKACEMNLKDHFFKNASFVSNRIAGTVCNQDDLLNNEASFATGDPHSSPTSMIFDSAGDVDGSLRHRKFTFDEAKDSRRDAISEIDIAAGLVLLKKKYHLSINCMDDIIHLLKSLHVKNTPSSWYKVKRVLNESKPRSKQYYICSVCQQSATDRVHCPNCLINHPVRPKSFHIFSIADQIQNVLINHLDIDLFYENVGMSMKDIRDGPVFQSILGRDHNPTLTLTMNIDGVKFSKNSQESIWPVIMVINELHPSVRFNIENIILADTWSASSKLTRDYIRRLFRPIIDELRQLELGHRFTLSNNQQVFIKVYLIAASCDKPAQSLVQCIAEPIAAYGCGRCEVQGDVIYGYACAPELERRR